MSHNFNKTWQLSYTRWTPIPCLLSVACSDKQALDLFFTPASTSVHLFREVSYGADETPSSAGAGPSSASSSSTYLRTPLSNATTSSPKQAPKLALRKARTCVASAVWWNRRDNLHCDVDDEGRARLRMEGEIHIPKELPPSFAFGPFKMKVCDIVNRNIFSRILVGAHYRSYRIVFDRHASFLRDRLRANRSRRQGTNIPHQRRNRDVARVWIKSTVIRSPRP